MNVQRMPLAAGMVEAHPFATPSPNEVAEMPEEVIITFPDGLIGCEGWKSFVLQDTEEVGSFKLLQSLDDQRISFVVTDPYLLLPDYSFEMTEADVNTVGLERPGDALVLCILVVKLKPELSVTANLLGPLVINVKRQSGVQVILPQSGYSARFPVMGSTNGKGA